MAGREEREIVATRVFDAPRALVFRMWTDPQHIAQWWGPNGFTNTIHEMDVRPGGVWRFVMHGPDGTDYQNRIVYREVVAPERIVYSHVSGPTFDATVTFDEEGAKTRVTMRMTFESAALRAKVAEEFGAVEGLAQTLDRLVEKVAAMEGEALLITRAFDAPRELVFDAWTDREQLARWWGPRGFTNPHCEIDVRPGGAIAIDMRGPDGTVYPMSGRFEELRRPERIVFTTSAIGGALQTLNEVTFEREGHRTRMTMRAVVLHAAPEANFAIAGMQEGWTQSLERLASAVPFVIARTFDAPRALVWKAWTESERMAQWFGPKGVTIIASKNDLRPGGLYHYGMRMPDGGEMWGKWVYREIVPPERLAFVSSFSDPDAGTTRAPFSEEWPLETLSVITFAEHEGKTTVTVQWSPLNATEAERRTFDAGRASMVGGWSGTFEALAAYLGAATASTSSQ